jgi:hypothetical protein
MRAQRAINLQVNNKKPGVAAGLTFSYRCCGDQAGCRLPAACLPRSVTIS